MGNYKTSYVNYSNMHVVFASTNSDYCGMSQVYHKNPTCFVGTARGNFSKALISCLTESSVQLNKNHHWVTANTCTSFQSVSQHGVINSY